MSIIVKMLFSVCCGMLLASCASIKKPYEVQEQIVKAYEDVVDMERHREITPNVFNFTTPYVEEVTSKKARLPDWVFSELGGFSATKVSLESISPFVMAALRGTGVRIEYLEGVEKDKEYDVFVTEGMTIYDMLEQVTGMSGLIYTATDNKLIWRKYLLERFELRIIGGDYEIAMGQRGRNQNGQTSGSSIQNEGAATSEFVGGSDDEYTTVSQSFNVLNDYRDGVKLVLGCTENGPADISTVEMKRDRNSARFLGETGAALPGTSEVNQLEALTNTFAGGGLGDGPTQTDTGQKQQGPVAQCNYGAQVDLVEGDNTLMVKALPFQMESVRQYIIEKQEYDKRQIRVNLTLFTVELNDENQLYLDLDVIERSINQGRYGLGVATNAVGSILGGLSSPRSVAVNHENGSSATLNALDEQGNVLQKQVLRGVSINNRVSQLTRVNKQSFIIERELQVNGSVTGSAQTGIKQSVAESGELLFMRPNIGEFEVMLHLSSSQSVLTALEPKGTGDNQVESPIIDEKLANVSILVRPGEPMFVGGFSNTILSAIIAESGLIPSIQRSSASKTIETVIMVEVEYL